MSASSYGIIAEGSYDAAVYSTIVQRLAPDGAHVKALECRGKDDLRKRFEGLLWAFAYEVEGKPVDMAIVIRDADGRNPNAIESEMRASVQNRHYPFRLGVRFHAVRNAMDAWLLADLNAINMACQRRTGTRVTKPVAGPEELLRPKESIRRLLSGHNVAYTQEVCREIAQEVDLNVLSQACPRFRVFTELVDC